MTAFQQKDASQTTGEKNSRKESSSKRGEQWRGTMGQVRSIQCQNAASAAGLILSSPHRQLTPAK
jgi:hypothetical protein